MRHVTGSLVHGQTYHNIAVSVRQSCWCEALSLGTQDSHVYMGVCSSHKICIQDCLIQQCAREQGLEGINTADLGRNDVREVGDAGAMQCSVYCFLRPTKQSEPTR